MCKAKARVAKCGHTVAYEIMLPCAQYSGTGTPCASWNENLLNKVFLSYHPICKDCHLQKEKKVAKQYIDGEMFSVRLSKLTKEKPAKEIWESRLRTGVKMQAAIYRLDEKVGREGEDKYI